MPVYTCEAGLHYSSDKEMERAHKRKRREEKRARKEKRRKRKGLSSEDQELHESHGPISPMPREIENGSASPTGEDERNAENGVFVWKKKVEALRRQGIRHTAEDERRRIQSIKEELEQAKLRRLKKEMERNEWEKDQARIAREREQEQNADWHRQEASFHGTQHFIRQAIRLRENRPTPADSLAGPIRLDLLDIPVESTSLPLIVQSQNEQITEIDSLIESVEVELDYIPDFPRDFDTEVFTRDLRLRWWTAMGEYLHNMKEAMHAQSAGGYVSGVHGTVQKDVKALLDGKDTSQLQTLEREISSQLDAQNAREGLACGGYGEVDFWNAALRRIRLSLSRFKLNDMAALLNKERVHLKEAQPKEEERPVLGHSSDAGHRSMNEDILVQAEEAKGLKPDEEMFSDEVEVKAPSKKPYVPAYQWNEKYRPRKPRYYNRVHTGTSSCFSSYASLQQCLNGPRKACCHLC